MNVVYFRQKKVINDINFK